VYEGRPEKAPNKADRYEAIEAINACEGRLCGGESIVYEILEMYNTEVETALAVAMIKSEWMKP